MNIHDPESWAELLLDVGKRNRLIHAGGARGAQVEIVAPTMEKLLQEAEIGERFSVVFCKPSAAKKRDTASAPEAPKVEIAADAEADGPANDETDAKVDPASEATKDAGEQVSAKADLCEDGNEAGKATAKEKGRFLEVCAHRGDPLQVMQGIRKKAKLLIEETGVNAAYMTFGSIVWFDPDDRQTTYEAPLLLLPVTVFNGSAAEPFAVIPEEDSPTVNPAFAYKLLREYHVELPEYASEGFEAYRKSVEERIAPLGFRTEASGLVGLFSFHKENMYRDLLENRARLLGHRHVQRLMGGAEALPEESTAATLPSRTDLHLIWDADASQTEAIEWARSGKSFVLQGPPGSGKSQTIANILAQAMCDGKRVLFVSEKQAALRVVYEKMEEAGLGGFCAELHSHRAGKKQFIEKLCNAIRATDGARDADEARVREDLGCAEDRLNAYATELHQKREGIEKSLFELLEAVEADRDTPDCNARIERLSERTETDLRQTEERFGELAELTQRLGADWQTSPWMLYTGTDPSYGVGMRLRAELSAALEALDRLQRVCSELPAAVKPYCQSIRRAEHLQGICRLLGEKEGFAPTLLERTLLLSVIERVIRLRSLAADVKSIGEGIAASYREDVLSWADFGDQRAFLKTVAKKRRRLFCRRYRALAARVRRARRDGEKPSYDEIVLLFDRLSVLSTRMHEFEKLEQSVKVFLGARWRGLESDWGAIGEALCELSHRIDALIEDGCIGAGTALPEMTDAAFVKRLSEDLADCLARGGASFARLGASFTGDGFAFAGADVGRAIALCRECLATFSQFEGRCHFNRLRERMKALGEWSFAKAALAQGIDASRLSRVYRKSFYRRWIDRILAGSDRFTRFSGIGLSRTADRFAELDRRLQRFERSYIRQRLLAYREAGSEPSAAASILREGEKKRRQKSIRTLLCEHGETVSRLTPCFFMSPLSVGTFLGEGSPHFDTVIFDEASQVFPQDALGAILRADQMIVVGDSRQMPPENFFESSVGEAFEEEGEQASDYESILDLATAAFPVCSLKWHYRSRSETLIDFSNKSFYNGELVTLPSAMRDGEALGIRFHRVDGVFEHGKRVNRKEAEYTVELILRHVKEHPRRSLGVVAFSTAQQELIERLLAKRRQSEPWAEDFFDPDRPEPFFIKNLETVQGDERDTVVFSVAYGYDRDGRFLQNFGPINRQGGERRINVAVTRAKYQIHVVASVCSADIIPPSDRGGVAALRNYLAYAEQHGSRQDPPKSAEAKDPKAPQDSNDTKALGAVADASFEASLCRFLKEQGFRAEVRVGASLYPIDVAVIDPKSGEYAVAIETDGKNYLALRNARDRNRLRPEALARMGWKHLRVWSADFMCGNGYGKLALLEQLQKLLGAEDTRKDA